MDQELSELLGSERSLGIMEIRTRAAVEVAGIRVEKTLVSRRQFSASAYQHPCFTGKQMAQANTGEHVQATTQEEREAEAADPEEDLGAGTMIHLNPVELGRWVDQRRVSLLGGYQPAEPLGQVVFGQPAPDQPPPPAPSEGEQP